MKIRKAEIQDAEDVKNLYNELRAYELSLFEEERGLEERAYPEMTTEEAGRIISSKDKATFVALADSRMVGFITGIIHEKATNYKTSTFVIYVKEELRKKGIGTELANTLLGWLKQNGCNNLLVNADLKNKNAKEFYDALGFKKIGEIYKMKV